MIIIIIKIIMTTYENDSDISDINGDNAKS